MARDHIVHARLTSNEKAVLRAAARLAGETLSEALRRPALRWAREIIAGGENATRGERAPGSHGFLHTKFLNFGLIPPEFARQEPGQRN